MDFVVWQSPAGLCQNPRDNLRKVGDVFNLVGDGWVAVFKTVVELQNN